MGNRAPMPVPNKKLGVPIASHVTSNLTYPINQRGSILNVFIIFPDASSSSEYSQLFHIITVSPRNIDMFCLLTGDIRSPRYTPAHGTLIISAVHCKESLLGNVIVVGESDRVFKVIDSYSLRSISQFSAPGASKISIMISPVPDLLYAGFHDGYVRVWHLAAQEPQLEIKEEGIIPGVRALAYSNKHRFILSGHDNTYQAADGSQAKLDPNPLRIYYMNALAQVFEPILLEGFTGSCLSVSLVESKNFAIALSSQESQVHIWDYLTCYKVLSFSVPSTGVTPELSCKIFSLALSDESDCLLIGKSDGSILASTLSLSLESLSVTWAPQQRIMPKLQERVADGIEVITFIDYIPRIDAVIAGNASSSAMIISNFFGDCLGLDLKDEQPKAIKTTDSTEESIDLKPGAELEMSSKEKLYEEERQRIWKALNEETKTT
ncbi:unnamed protein product [Blepharisma stoltei]|uniref:Uncharacterized protein n=1 Tax=Blepharisma stoltei TaxID=1481888 RepID=A0AAU9JPJ9_9CILI|nr:unnamed protein product [Blepharisma stoltei]